MPYMNGMGLLFHSHLYLYHLRSFLVIPLFFVGYAFFLAEVMFFQDKTPPQNKVIYIIKTERKS